MRTMESKVFHSLSDSYLLGLGGSRSHSMSIERDEFIGEKRREEVVQVEVGVEEEECIIEHVKIFNNFSTNSNSSSTNVGNTRSNNNHPPCLNTDLDLSSLEFDIKSLRDDSRELNFIHEIQQEIREYQQSQEKSRKTNNCATDSSSSTTNTQKKQEDTAPNPKQGQESIRKDAINRGLRNFLKKLPSAKINKEELSQINNFFKWKRSANNRGLRRTLSAGAETGNNINCTVKGISSVGQQVVEESDETGGKDDVKRVKPCEGIQELEIEEDDVFNSSTETLKNFNNAKRELTETLVNSLNGIRNGGGAVLSSLTEKCGQLPKFFNATKDFLGTFPAPRPRRNSNHGGNVINVDVDSSGRRRFGLSSGNVESFAGEYREFSSVVQLPPVEKLYGVAELKISNNSSLYPKRKSRDTDSGMEDDERSENGGAGFQANIHDSLDDKKVGGGMTGDADSSTSSTYYSTAEEDYLEPEAERVVTSSYGTPTASLSASKFSLLSGFSSGSGSGTGPDSPTRPSSRSRGEHSFGGSSLNIRPDSDSDNIDKDEIQAGLLRRRSSRKRRSSRRSLKRHNSGNAGMESKLVKEINLPLDLGSPKKNEEVAGGTTGSPVTADSGDVNKSAGAFLTEGGAIEVKDLQGIFNCFKDDDISKNDCGILLDSLGAAQAREDFQRALHQMGGFNALIFLHARVVEICQDDETQSKSLNIVLSQLRNHFRLTDGPSHRQYHLVRFVLSSDKSTFAFKTFINVLSYCLSPSGLKLLDYQLLDTCILTSWKNMIRVRCTPNDAPTGPKTLFECLLIVVLDLLEEKNPHRDFNVALLKANRFAETLLAICYQLVVDVSHSLTLVDGVRISALVKSILAELMAPPDAYVGVTLVQYGLCPLLPRELPPLPRKEDAFFVFQDCGKSSAAFLHNLRNIREAEEAEEEDRLGNAASSEPESDQYLQKMGELEAPSAGKIEEDPPIVKLKDASGEPNIDVPEILGVQNNGKEGEQQLVVTEESAEDGFAEAFQESLVEGVMSILLNALSILPDGAFDSVLKQSLNAYIFVAYCSHPSVRLKKLALKLLSAYLTRVKNPVVMEFMKSKGFFLASLYIQGNPEVSQLVLNICHGFGPLSYSLITALLYSNTVVNAVLEWVKADEAIIPALLSMGLMPSIFNINASSISSIQKPLQNLLVTVTRYCTLHPKDDPWKVLFCPALESGYGNCALVPKIIQDATEFLRKNRRKDLKKSDSNSRLMWLMERGSAGKMGQGFDKWLLTIFTLHIMEMEEEDETEYWIHFVKKNRKKLHYLMGIFLCRVFSANTGNLDFKHYTARVFITFCPNIAKWLPKVVKCEEKVERCLTAFIRIFLTTAEQKTSRAEGHLRSPSFHSLISDNGNLTLTLQVSEDVERRNSVSSTPEHLLTRWNREPDTGIGGTEDGGDPGGFQLSDRAVRARFETILVDAGVLSPTNSFSTFSADFKNFKILVDSHASGVSAIELRQCIACVEKLRAPFLLSFSKIKINTPDNNTGAKVGPPNKQCFANAGYFEEVFEAVHSYAMEMLINVARNRTQQEIQVARRVSLQDDDVKTIKNWLNVREQLVHPKAPWHFAESYPSFSALDQSEGPARVRMRLKREFLKVHNRFVQPKYRKTGPPKQPLDYLFQSHSAELLKQPLILNEIQYMRFCTRIIPGEELPGEIILTADNLTFIAENASLQSENVEVRKTGISYLMKRRYTLEDRAVEIFLECRSFLFVFKTTKDRDEFVSLLSLKHVTNNNVQFHSVSSSLMDTNITSMTSQWLKGHISNFEYLMYLNTAAGRTYCDLMQYPVFPFILSKYDTPTLDLLAPQSYRDLKKPMAIQDPAKEEHFVSTYNYLKRECDSAPFHYGSHYSNSGIILHFLVRLPPYTQHFLTYQDGSFDIPDRSFHSIDTTWRLASRESNTDFKEAIPEFFYLPEFLQNLQHFDLGVRQSGNRVDDVILPPWAKGSARLFTLVNRQALESNYVRKSLCHWIDLIFGYKQTGKAALQALNVFHPSTYEGFEVEATGDELLMRARKAMVSTYGQTPKQLFANYPHPRASGLVEEKCDMEVLDTVWGIRWGQFIGSPACPDLEVVNTREYSEYMDLFETDTRIVFWPEKTLILGDNIVGSWDANSIRIKAKNIFNTVDDYITVCVGTANSIWVGHQSGRISVLKLSEKLDQVTVRTELVGHYKPIKSINVNQEFSMAISCAGENYAILWDINKYPKIAYNNFIECSSPVDYVYSSRSTGDVVLLNKENNLVTLATINGFIIGTIQPDSVVESVCLSTLDPGRNVNVVAVGCNNGNIRFYSTWDLKFLNQLKVVPLTAVSVMSVRYSRDGRRLYCMSQTEEGAITVALQLPPDRKFF